MFNCYKNCVKCRPYRREIPLQLSGCIPILSEKILVDLTLRTQQMAIKEQEFLCAGGRVDKFAGPRDLFLPEIHVTRLQDLHDSQ